MSIVRHTVVPTVLALLLAGSGCAPFPVNTAGTTASPAPTLAVGDLRGQVSVPVVAAGSANVVAAGSANVVAAGSANVVAAGSANVIAPGGANYRLAQAAAPAEELPVFGAVVILRDAVTRQRLPWAQPTFTDEQGRFHFPQVPAGMNYLVEVVFLTRDGRSMRLLTLAQAGTTDRAVAVDWRTTAVVTAMQSAANAEGGLYVTDPQAMDTAIAELGKAAAAMPVAEREATLTKAVTATQAKPTGQEAAVVAPAAVDAMRGRLEAMTGAKLNAGTLVISEVMPPAELAPARDVAEAMASKSPALAQALSTLRGLAAATPTAAQQSTATQAGQLGTGQATPAPSSGNGSSGTAASGVTSPGGASAGVTTGTGATVSTGTGTEASVTTGTGGTTINAGTGTGTEAAVSTGANGTEASVSTGTGTEASVSTGTGGTQASVDTGVGADANVSTGSTGTQAGVSAGGTTTTVSTGSDGTTAGTTTSSGTGATATTGSGGTSVGVNLGGGTSVTVGTGGSTGISLGGKKILP
jgi:hypothetical protein